MCTIALVTATGCACFGAGYTVSCADAPSETTSKNERNIFMSIVLKLLLIHFFSINHQQSVTMQVIGARVH